MACEFYSNYILIISIWSTKYFDQYCKHLSLSKNAWLNGQEGCSCTPFSILFRKDFDVNLPRTTRTNNLIHLTSDTKMFCLKILLELFSVIWSFKLTVFHLLSLLLISYQICQLNCFLVWILYKWRFKILH